MKKSKYSKLHQFLLEVHRKGVEQAIDLSIRTGVPLVVQVEGIIKEIKPKYKYVKVPIRKKPTKRQPKSL